MKKILILSFMLLACYRIFSQGVAVNTNGAPADNSAMLDVSSHDRGVLIPRLRTSERLGITNPAQGLLVYDLETKTFWYFDVGSWHEILFNGGAVTPTGIAGGDLSGNYPTPSVVKIQNLDIATGIPFDRQVLKWDGLNNRWQGLNDSLFLPYNVTFGSPTKLFGITNANTTPGSSAIYGKSGNAGSGQSPSGTVGVWGDNSTGAGVLGSSNSSSGVFGFSSQQHGITGFSIGANFAGVYGTNSIANGKGLMGEISTTGNAVYGKSTGVNGNAAWFENTSTASTDPTEKVIQNGIGNGSVVSLPNTSSSGDGINISVAGSGNAVNAKSDYGAAGSFNVTNPVNTSTAIGINNSGLGLGASIQQLNNTSTAITLLGSNYSKGAGLVLGMYNLSNAADGIDITHNGTGNGIYAHVTSGRAAWFDNTSTTTTNDLLYANNLGKGNAGKFITNNSSNSNPGVSVNTNGTGRGLEAIISNSASTAAAVYASSSGNNGVQAYALSTGVLGQSTGLTGGIGVLGQSSLNSNDGIGVKGISYSSVTTSGSVTGINNSDGIGIYGSAAATGGNGIGVYGTSASVNSFGVKGYSQSTAFDGGAAVYGYNDAGGQGVYGYSYGLNAVSIHGIADPTLGTSGYGVVGQSFGNGDGVRGFGGGVGNGVSGFAYDNSGGIGVYGEINGGTGYAIKGASNISNRPAILGLNSSGDGVAGTTNGTGYGVRASGGTTGAGLYASPNPISATGRAAIFEIPAATNTYDAVLVNQYGTGTSLYLTSYNTATTKPTVVISNYGNNDDYFLCKGSALNYIRFNNSGKGFFNGGTQTGGADMAESFAVTGNIKTYEPGDIMIIDVDNDRTVTRSKEAYSNLVAGVYATKPGVLMTEENIDADLSNNVPMGVVGVIPTKVCLEGGEIKRGDFLVTSSIPGVAMKANLEKLKAGQMIGKALENFSDTKTGKIKVLVNVK